MKTLIIYSFLIFFTQCILAQDFFVEDEQAVAELTSTNTNNGSVITLVNSTPGVPFGISGYVGAINFERLGLTPGQIGYQVAPLAHSKMNFRIGGYPVMALYDTTKIFGVSHNHLEMANGAVCTAGGVWSNNCSAKLKNLHYRLDSHSILDLVNKLPIYHWSYKSNSNETHLGPTAEDFHDLFNVGVSNEKLSSIDLSGVSIAAIQALYERIQALELSLHKLNTKSKE